MTRPRRTCKEASAKDTIEGLVGYEVAEFPVFLDKCHQEIAELLRHGIEKAKTPTTSLTKSERQKINKTLCDDIRRRADAIAETLCIQADDQPDVVAVKLTLGQHIRRWWNALTDTIVHVIGAGARMVKECGVAVANAIAHLCRLIKGLFV